MKYILVEYVLQDYRRPIGMATYKMSQEKLKELLSDEEEMRKLFVNQYFV